MSKEKEIAEEYASSLADLTVNSKPLINMLTILAEENVEHAGVIVDTVEKHLEKVHPDIKLPVLYLVDSIIKNVSGAYVQKFSQCIVNMFTRTFKQVDEKVRSQMFKLRETWHEVFPATKLYQLDVKVNLIDPAWPIQAQPQQSNIHVNPNFLKKTSAPSVSVPAVIDEEEKMRSLLVKKEQELLMLQRKKIEMELEKTKRELELAEKSAKVAPPILPPSIPPMPVAMVNPVMAPVMQVPPEVPVCVPVKQRLGPPVNKVGGSRIAPVSRALAAARRDPRLARMQPAHPAPHPAHPAPEIAPNVFDIKPLERVTKRKNVITIDVRPELADTPPREPRRRDPRLDHRRDKRHDDRRNEKKLDDAKNTDDVPKKVDELKKKDEPRKAKDDVKKTDDKLNADKNSVEKHTKNDQDANSFLNMFNIADAKKINKLPPIPKINRDDAKNRDSAPAKRKKDSNSVEKKKKRDNGVNSSSSSKDSSCTSSPEKKSKRETRKSKKEKVAEVEEKSDSEVIAFKELKNYHKERYMRRNKEKSESPEKLVEDKKDDEKPVQEIESSNVPEIIDENKDVDLRVLPTVEVKGAPVSQKRPSIEALESKPKKNKVDKFDILFGNEDVDLRQLPQVEEVAPPPPSINDSPRKSPKITPMSEDEEKATDSKEKDWHELKEKDVSGKTPSKLDLVRAKLAEATKGQDKDRLGRPLLFSKSPSVERERRRTLSSDEKDIDLRAEPSEDFDAENHKKTISIIMSQAKEQYNDGQLDKNQYNTLMYQVMQLNEKLKLKEAKQRESLEISKRKLKQHIDDNNKSSPKSSPVQTNTNNTFGDIDERVTPAVFVDTPPDSQNFLQDSDMRMKSMPYIDMPEIRPGAIPPPPGPPSMPFLPPYNPMWRGQNRPRADEFNARRFRGQNPQFFRGKFDKRGVRPNFEPRLPVTLPTPVLGNCQSESPLSVYERVQSPPPMGTPGIILPPTDLRVLEFIDQDPVKSIQIDGIPREIRYYGDTAVIMMDWDDPRELKFLPGCRRVTFDNKDSVVVHFNEGYKQVEIDDQVFNMKFGAPTRELYINGRWYEAFFGGQPIGVLIDGKARLVQLEGPLPQVDIGKSKRSDLVAGKINLIVNATNICPVFLDAKVQKFLINGHYFTLRFTDAFRTVLINEQPFKVEFGDLPKPIFLGNEKVFIRFSALPRHVKPGLTTVANMEGLALPLIMNPVMSVDVPRKMEVDEDPLTRPVKTPSPDGERQGLDMLASFMPSSDVTPSSASEYTSEPFFTKNAKIPGLETPGDEKPSKPVFSILGNLNVSDLFAKLVATGIVPASNDVKKEEKKDDEDKKKEDKNVIHKVDLLKPETLRVKQPALVSALYGGMQCSGCGARFPPERTVKYSQHLDWHFRANRRERDSARRAHSRHWGYDLSDWLRYEELEDLEEREKSWFETTATTEPAAPETAAPSVAAPGGPLGPLVANCALCGDRFLQFYNEDKEEWHLRNSVAYDGENYHPACLEDYKASLNKKEPADESTEEVTVKETEEAIEIKDIDDDMQDESDNEVEVVEECTEIPEPVEIDEEGDEDDVVLKQEPLPHVDVDDADTDDETSAERGERDRQAAIDFAKVKVKLEPADPDDEPIITAEETIQPINEPAHPTVVSSIDGNFQLEQTPIAPVNPSASFRINISKSISSFITPVTEDKMLEDISADDEPLPPGEEPELEYKLKPSLEGVQLSRQPPIQKGKELSGLCSIM